MKNAIVEAMSKPVVAAKYANTSDVVVDSALTKETMQNVITLTPMGELCVRLVQNQGTEDYSFSRKAIMSAQGLKAKDADNAVKFAGRFYGELSVMCDLREKAAGASSELQNAENAVKVSADSWFLWVGTRKPKKNDTKPRPAYGVRYADFSIFGELANEARKAAGEKLEAIPEKFLELLMLATGRILSGKPLGRVSEDELRAARAKAVKARARKAAETKKENAEKEKEKAAEKKAEEKAAESEKKEKTAQVVDIANSIVDAVSNSHATEEEKKAIMELVKKLAMAAGN